MTAPAPAPAPAGKNAPSYTEQIAQYSVESTFGAAQEPERRFVRSTVTIKPTTTTEKLSASGSYYTTSVYRTSDESEGTLSGVPDVNELADILDLVFGVAVPQALSAGGKQRTYKLSLNRPTWTVVFGSAEAASQAVAMFAKMFSLDLGINSKTAKIEVGLSGGKFTDGAAINPDATAVPESILTALQAKVTQAVSWSDLATSTTSAEAISIMHKWDSLARSESYMDGTDSISATVNTRGTNTIELMVPKNSNGIAYLAAIRSGQTRYLRTLLQGEVISGSGNTAVREGLDIRVPVKVSEQDRPEQDGAYVVKPTLEMVEDVDGNVPTLILTSKN